jgi:hypothetical protein
VKLQSRTSSGQSDIQCWRKEETTMKQFIEDNLGRANLGTFLVFGSGGGWEDEGKALAEMWTETTRDKYKVTVTFDRWDRHPKTKNQDTQGTIALDGVERKWRLIPDASGEPLSGSGISIELPNDSDDWHLDWILRPDWCVINYLVLDALVTRNPCDPISAFEWRRKQREKMTRLRRYVESRGLIQPWSVPPKQFESAF